MDQTRAPRKKTTRRTASSPLITSPYFPIPKTRRLVKMELENPVSPSKDEISQMPDFTSFQCHESLPMGPKIDMDAPCTVRLSEAEEDLGGLEAEFQTQKFEDPARAFELRKGVYLRYKLHCAKPVLIQEKVADDPWKLLIAVVLLNKTAGKSSIPVFWKILERWPTPEALSNANVDDLRTLIQPLGLQDIRAKRLIKLSACYLSNPPRTDKLYPSRATYAYVQVDKQTQRAKLVIQVKYPPTPVSHLPGVGAYALDSYRIFCAPGDEWMQVLPTDKELIRYLKWKWAFFESQRWEPDRGVVAPLNEDYLTVLPSLISG